MCVCPIRIKNPKIKTGSFVKTRDPLYLTVPCGKCWQCLQSKQSDWICRNYFEYLKTSRERGTTFYYTLTYDDKNLFSHGSVRLFDFNKVRKCLRKLQMRCLRRGLNCKYFLVSELGSRTERPHHHALFYITGKNQYNYNEFDNVLNECWNFGNIKCGDFHGVVNSPFAIYYVSKYCGKYGKKVQITSPSNIPSFKRFASYINRHFGCNIRCSSGLGRERIKSILYHELKDGFIHIPVDKKFVKVRIPEYYLRKTIKEPFKNCHDNISYKLNKKGIDLLDFRFEDLVKNLKKKCDLINTVYGTDFTSDFILHCQLHDSLPYKLVCSSLSFKTLYFHRKINNGYEKNPVFEKDNDVHRFYLSSDEQARYSEFINFNKKIAYDKYRKNQENYNLKQRLLYPEKKEIRVLSFYEFLNYVPTFNKLAVRRETNSLNCFLASRDFKHYKAFERLRRRYA